MITRVIKQGYFWKLSNSRVFNTKYMMSDYTSKPYHECPMCKKGQKLDAIVNTYGISSFTEKPVK